MNLDALGRIVWDKRRPPRGLDPGLAAIAALPEAADGLPAARVDADGAYILSSSGALLEAPVRRALEAALRDAPAASPDLLASVLAERMAAGLAHSPGAGVVPVLEVLRLCAAQLAAPGPELAAAVTALRALEPDAQGAALARTAARLQASMGGALAVLARAGHAVPALAQAAVGSRLALLFEPGTLDVEASMPLLAAVVESGVPADTVAAGVAALRATAGAVLERRAAGKETADDQALTLRHLPPDLADRGVADITRAWLGSADAAAWILPQLARFTDARALGRAGVASGLTRDLLRTEQGIALAAALADVLNELRRWEVLAPLAAALRPADEADRRADHALLVPHGPTDAIVVAVGRRAGSGAWADRIPEADGVVTADLGFCGLAVFLDPLAALRFALRAGGGADGAPVGVGIGAVVGGTDGQTVRIGGPAVDLALHWLASAPLPAVDGAHALALHGGRLCGHGVGVAAAAADAIEAARHAAGLRTDAAPGGDARAPRSLDVVRTIELDGDVLTFARIAGVPGGVEVIRFAPADWRAFLAADTARHGAPGSAPHGAGADPFAAAPVASRAAAAAAAAAASFGGTAPPAPTAAPAVDPFAASSAADPAAAAVPAASPAAAPATASPAAPAVDPFAAASPESTPAAASFVPAAPQAPAAVAPAAPAAAASFVPAASPTAPADPFARAPADGDPFAGESAAALIAAPAEPRPATPRDPFADPWGAPPAEADEPAPAPGTFSDFFLPGAGEPEPTTLAPPVRPQPASPAAEAWNVDIDIDDEPSNVHAVQPARAEDPGFDVPDSPMVYRPRGIKVDSGRAYGETELQPRRSAAAVDEGGDIQLEQLLRGYCSFVDGGQVVFGRPFGSRIVDRHAYPYRGDLDDAYRTFLEAKLADGFIPRNEQVGDLPRGVTLAPLDPERLTMIWKQLT